LNNLQLMEQEPKPGDSLKRRLAESKNPEAQKVLENATESPACMRCWASLFHT